jgi:hypothetical protein
MARRNTRVLFLTLGADWLGDSGVSQGETGRQEGSAARALHVSLGPLLGVHMVEEWVGGLLSVSDTVVGGFPS